MMSQSSRWYVEHFGRKTLADTRQLNRVDTGHENQIEKFKRQKLFTQSALPPASELEAYPKLEDQEAPLEKRARAYLDVNCALCHSPGGFGTAGGSKADLNFHQAFETAFAVPPKSGPDAKRWVTPGQPQHSQLIQRMKSRYPKDQMPPLATQLPDHTALDMLQRWIEEMKEQ